MGKEREGMGRDEKGILSCIVALGSLQYCVK